MRLLPPASLLVLVAAAAPAQTWPAFADETGARLIAIPTVGTADVAEKDYAWGDVDQDGDIDLVCVRKEPWNTEGRRRNVLFLNEGIAEGHLFDGILVDRSLEFASDASDGGEGFLDLTNDRDVALADLDGDGWLDLLTATTYGSDFPKTISHPRIYRNLGAPAGTWLGFRYEESRTPTMPLAPNFCGIGIGDVNADGALDAYFVEYNNDLEDRLWINDGTGTFIDETTTRLTPEMVTSDFGVHTVIADMNGDGALDILKDHGSTLSNPPLRVTISYNDPANLGNYTDFEVIYNGSPYFATVGDLNNDALPDIVIDDDGIDRYLLNQGNGADGFADFAPFTFPPDSNGFGGNILIDDIDLDGFDDVVIADVDVDCCGCPRHMHIWRNQADPPNVTFAEQDGGIPDAARTGTHDVAIFDVNGDGWKDFVIGTCTGMSIWIAQPALVITYPDGSLPETVPPDEPITLAVMIAPGVGAELEPGSARAHISINGAAESTVDLTPLGGDAYEMELPALDCFEQLAMYISAQTTTGATFTDPPAAPADRYTTVATTDALLFVDDMEAATGWTVVNDPALASGGWQRADPNGTISLGALAAPDDDASELGTIAYVTENGPVGGDEAANDVDGGPTILVSPLFDLSGGDAALTYARWFYCSDEGDPVREDALRVELSNDGGTAWTPVPEHTTTGTGSAWETVSLLVGDHVAPTATVRVRFLVDDIPNDSVTEAGIDDVRVGGGCAETCAADVDGDGTVNLTDLNIVLAGFGAVGADLPGDADGDGAVNVNDLNIVLAAFGEPCAGDLP